MKWSLLFSIGGSVFVIIGMVLMVMAKAPPLSFLPMVVLLGGALYLVVRDVNAALKK